MHHFLRPGDLVYDIGAEEGDQSCLYAQWGCDVVLFEPNPQVWPNLRLNFEANGLTDRVRAYWVGFVGDEVSDTHDVMYSARPSLLHYGGRTFWPTEARGPVCPDHLHVNLAERPDLRCTTIDQAAKHLSPPDVLTIDVEGAEARVLAGAEQVLREVRPLVFCSIHPLAMRLYFDGPEGLHDRMRHLGYTATYLATDHEEHWMFTP